MMFKRLGILTILVVLALMVSVPAVFARGQALATGSIHIQPGYVNDPDLGWIPSDVQIHINFNARQVNDAGVGTGHVFWRQDGQINRVSVDTLVFEWFFPECAYISGIAHSGPRAGERLCFVFCDDPFVLGAAWDGPPAYIGSTPVLSGNIVIKP